jgi:molybdate transport system substrate-binding protein
VGRLIRGVLVGALILGLARGAPAADVVVFAAASLADVLRELAASWHAQRADHLVLTFGASSDLARQIRAGAPAAVFFSADVRRVEELEREGLVAAGSRHDVLSNQLAVIVPLDAPFVPAKPQDLEACRRIALADPEAVPAGVYARTWLGSIGLWEKIRDRVVPTADVRAALAAVEAGHADAGVVYETDTRVTSRVRRAFTVPREAGPPILYSVAALAGRPAGAEVVRFLVSAAALAVYERHGFAVNEPR